jgi:hypothetical protein
MSWINSNRILSIQSNETLLPFGDTAQSLYVQGPQPIVAFAPDISDQVISITEGQSFNVQIALDTNSNIVNQYGETNAPSWAVLNQITGVFNGTAPAYTGSSDDYIIACKGANVLGGITNFSVTLRVL